MDVAAVRVIALLLLTTSPAFADSADEIRVAMAMAAAVKKPDAKPVPVVRAQPATHSHRCPACGTVWSHGDDSFGNVAAHRCPRCGRVQWQVYQRLAVKPPCPT